MNDRLRGEQEHSDGRNRQRAEGQRRPIDHHADENDRDHDEGALGRNLGTGKQEIQCGDDERREGRPFLDWVIAVSFCLMWSRRLPEIGLFSV
jgi:hypothetical protein